MIHGGQQAHQDTRAPKAEPQVKSQKLRLGKTSQGQLVNNQGVCLTGKGKVQSFTGKVMLGPGLCEEPVRSDGRKGFMVGWPTTCGK